VTKTRLGSPGNTIIRRPFFKLILLKKIKRHYFDFWFWWHLPNIQFWLNIRPNIRPIVSAVTTFGWTHTGREEQKEIKIKKTTS
jgi:hypothetical protein